MMKLSIESLKAAASDPACLRAAKNVFMAMAVADTMRDKVVPIQHAVLENGKWPPAPKIASILKEKGFDASYIKSPNRAYEMAPCNFSKYVAACYAEYVKAGIAPDDPENCPLLVAENLQRQAEVAFIDTLETFTGLNSDQLYMPEYRREYLQIMLSMFAQKVKSTTYETAPGAR